MLNSISTFCLIPFLGEFYEKHPKTDVRLSTNWSLPPSDQNEVDLIIGYGKKIVGQITMLISYVAIS
ncbi:type 2 periplasmic-binding domain-containing protein [Paraphotobacterium marinum]|uniref:hypothetical protein n=1 Tax=Paraphotobacterium marinum TaxID=1755811 RepID=UPI001314328E|nr:hypothetical protein [Paraphotobacterium marinum]